MTFAVEGLPPGLSLDPPTGRIAGTLSQRGEFPVTFQATNALGTARRGFKIVCGDTVALTPEMGWNHWYMWTGEVTDKIIRDAADVMVSSGMINHGYIYVNIDDCWANGRAEGRRFRRPDSRRRRQGQREQAFSQHEGPDRLHPSPRPAGRHLHLAGADHLRRLHRRLPARGAGRPAIRRVGLRFPQVRLVLVPGVAGPPGALPQDVGVSQEAAPRHRAELLPVRQRRRVEMGPRAGGNSWRTADDLGRGYLTGQFDLIGREVFDHYAAHELHKYAGPGAWNDPDYLQLGHLSYGPTNLSPDAQYSQVSLWSLVAAPLIFGGDISRLDDFTLNLLSNDEVIEVDQDPLGKAGHRVAKDGDQEVWARPLGDGSLAVGLFNRNEMEATVTANWSDLGVQGKQRVRDLWRQKELGTLEGRFSTLVPAQGVMLLRLWPAEK